MRLLSPVFWPKTLTLETRYRASVPTLTWGERRTDIPPPKWTPSELPRSETFPDCESLFLADTKYSPGPTVAKRPNRPRGAMAFRLALTEMAERSTLTPDGEPLIS